MTGLGLAAGLVVGACQSAGVFVCTGSGDCVDGGVAGSCEANGRCSFPDDQCPSDRRYGRFAGELSGVCVPTDDGTGDDGADPIETSDPGDEAGTSALDGAGESGEPGEPGDTTAADPAVLEFGDEREEDFAAGEQDGVAWVDGGVQLADATEGVQISRVFDAVQPVSWTSMRWVPRAPYGKPLPRDAESEVGYREGNANMSETLLLLHLDGSGPASPASILEDASGLGHDLRLESPDDVPRVLGPFGQALDDDMDSYAYNDTWQDVFSFQQSDYTWSLWVRTSSSCANGNGVEDNQVYLGLDGEGANRSHLWLGCRNNSADSCSGSNADLGRAGGSFSPNQAAGGARVCSPQPVVDGQWHHVAVTKTGQSEGTTILYFDGETAHQVGTMNQDPVEFPPGTELALGAFREGTFPAAVTLDEVAIWRRRLSPGEIAGLYRRGVLRLRVRVRSCGEPDCASAGPFVGPDGTPDTSYEDDVDLAGPGTEISLPDGLEGRYFQYRVELEGLPDASPVLEAVSISASV